MKLKKKKGELPIDGISVYLAIIFMAVIVLAGSGSMEVMWNYQKANGIGFKYETRMESYGNGYLTSDDESSLESDMANEGFTNLDLTGTTMVQVDNGGYIYLNMAFDEQVKQFEIKNNFPAYENVTKRVTIHYSTTSKN